MQPDLATSLPALSLDELQPATAASTHASNVVVPEPLRSLIDAGDVRGIEALGDVDFRQPYDDFRTPTLLHRALDLGHERLCAHMLRAGGEALARAPGLHSATLAHVAARRGNVEALRTILRLVPEFLRAEDELGCFGANPGWICLSWSCDFSRIVSAAASAAVSSACSAFSFAMWYSALPT